MNVTCASAAAPGFGRLAFPIRNSLPRVFPISRLETNFCRRTISEGKGGLEGIEMLKPLACFIAALASFFLKRQPFSGYVIRLISGRVVSSDNISMPCSQLDLAT